MSLTSSSTRYGTVAVAIHWLTAFAIFGMLWSGLSAAGATDEATRLTLLRGHAVMGSLVGLLTVFRIVWWLAVDTRPADPSGQPRLQALAAKAVHYGLYAVILVMVASGLGTVLLSGANMQLLGLGAGPLPDFASVPPMSVHGLLSRLLIGLIVLHVAAALWHQFIRRDGLIGRMRLGA
jgi:cytochrome b561